MESKGRGVLDTRLRGYDDSSAAVLVGNPARAYLHGLESLTSNLPIAPEMTKSL